MHIVAKGVVKMRNCDVNLLRTAFILLFGVEAFTDLGILPSDYMIFVQTLAINWLFYLSQHIIIMSILSGDPCSECWDGSPNCHYKPELRIVKIESTIIISQYNLAASWNKSPSRFD